MYFLAGPHLMKTNLRSKFVLACQHHAKEERREEKQSSKKEEKQNDDKLRKEKNCNVLGFLNGISLN